MSRLLSVNVGLPRDVIWNGKTVRTSVWKSPVDGRRMVRKLDIDGDAQDDLAGHGGDHSRRIRLPDGETCDVPVRWSCPGFIIPGMTGLIGGSITYDPRPLEEPAPENVLVCCSRPNAGVTLDL